FAFPDAWGAAQGVVSGRPRAWTSRPHPVTALRPRWVGREADAPASLVDRRVVRVVGRDLPGRAVVARADRRVSGAPGTGLPAANVFRAPSPGTPACARAAGWRTPRAGCPSR